MLVRLAVAAAMTVTMLSAQPLKWEVAPVAGYLGLSKKVIGSANLDAPKDDDTTLHSKQPVYGLRLTRNTKGYWGFEATLLRSRARIDSKLFPQDGSSTETVLETGNIWIHQAFFNGISYFMPNGERFRPYMTAGMQVQLYGKPPMPDWPFGRSRKLGFNYGGGLKVQLSKNVLFRIDARDILGGSPYDLQFDTASSLSLRSPGLFRQLEGTIGIGIRF
jgi:opacity protein-like surface antigen